MVVGRCGGGEVCGVVWVGLQGGGVRGIRNFQLMHHLRIHKASYNKSYFHVSPFCFYSLFLSIIRASPMLSVTALE